MKGCHCNELPDHTLNNGVVKNRESLRGFNNNCNIHPICAYIHVCVHIHTYMYMNIFKGRVPSQLAAWKMYRGGSMGKVRIIIRN